MNPVGRVQTSVGVAHFPELEAFYHYVDYLVENGLPFNAETLTDSGWQTVARSVCWWVNPPASLAS